MSFEECVKASAFAAKNANIQLSKRQLEQFAEVIENLRSKNLSPAEFQAEIQANLDALVNRATEISLAREYVSLAKRETALKTLLSSKLPIKERFRNWILGGSLKSDFGSNIDVKRLEAVYRADFLKIWRRGLEGTKDFLKGLSDSGSAAKRSEFNFFIYQELDALENGLPIGKTGSKEAVQIAKTINAILSRIFDKRKAFNPGLEKIKDYLIKQFHSPERLRLFGKEEWKADIKRLYGSKSFDGLGLTEVEEKLDRIYDRITKGVYGTIQDEEEWQNLFNKKDLFGRITRQRSLIPNDWRAMAEYNQKYGYGTPEDTIMKIINTSSRELALLDKFGPNPQEMYRDLLSRLVSRSSEEEKDVLLSNKTSFDRMFSAVNENYNSYATSAVGKFIEGSLNLTRLAKLGGQVLRSIPDIFLAAGLLRGINGNSVFGNAFDIVSNYAKFFTDSKSRITALEDLNLFSQAYMNDLFKDFSVAEGQGAFGGKMMEALGKYTLINRHVDAMRSATGLLVSRSLSRYADLEYAKLSSFLKDNLSRYEIGELEWEAIRQGVDDWSVLGKEFSGKRFLSVNGVDSLSDDVVRSYIVKSGKTLSGGKISKELIAQTRDFLSNRLGLLIHDHVDLASSTAGSRQRAFLLQGTNPNTVEGMVLRVVTQFKSAALTSQDVYRRVFNSGVTTGGDWAGIAQMAAGSMFMWGIGEYTKQILQNKEPEDSSSFSFIGRAMAGSGAAGLIGEALLAELERQGGGDSSFLGPLVGTGFKAVGLAKKVGSSFVDDKRDFPIRESFDFGYSNFVPFNNLFYATGAMNYLLLNNVKEFLDDGYIRELQRDIRKEKDYLGDRREYLFGPALGSE